MPPNQQTNEEREMLRDLLAVLDCEHCAHFTPLVEALEGVERRVWGYTAKCRHKLKPYIYEGETVIDECEKTQWDPRGWPTHEGSMHKFDPPPFVPSDILATVRREGGASG